MDNEFGGMNLKASVGLTIDSNPDYEAELRKVSQTTGVPVDTARNIPEVTKEAKIQSLRLDEIERDFPSTTKFLSNPENSSVAHDDIPVMQKLENSWKSFKRGIDKGSIQDELGGLNYLALEGTIGPEQQARRRQLKDQMGLLDQEAKDDKGLAYFTGQTGYSGRQMVSSFREGGKGALVGAVSLAGAAAIAGQLGPQIATPEEIVTVPGAAMLGARTGFVVGSAVYNYKTEAGFAFDEFENMVDENGKPLNIEVARGAAAAVGLLNSGLETVGEMAMIKLIPGLGNIMGMGSKEAVKQLLAKPTAAKAIAEASKKWVQASTIEGMTEALQELGVIIGREGAELVSGQQFADQPKGADLERIQGAGIDAFIGSLGVGIPSAGARVYTDTKRAVQAQRDQQVIQALGESAQESKLLKRLPEKYQELVTRLKENGPIDNVFIPVEQFSQYFQSKGIDPSQAASEIGANNFAEALAAGTDIVIPIEQYATKVAPTEAHQALSQDIKFNQGDLTAREYESYLQQKQQMEASVMESIKSLQAQEQSSIPEVETIKQSMVDQLTKTGAELSTAEAYATSYVNAISTLAQRSGMSPMDLHDRYGLTISRQVPDALQAGTADITMDPLLDMIRADKLPSDSQIYGPSLSEFVLSKGGIRPTETAGELRTMDEGKRGFKRFGRPNAKLTLDEMAMSAVESGYFPGKSYGSSGLTEAEFLDALDRDQSKPIYSMNNTNSKLEELRRIGDEITSYLKQLGFDIKAITDNTQVRKIIEEGVKNNVPEESDAYKYFLQSGMVQTIDVDGVERPTTNSEGKQIGRTADEIRNFWRWFGDSKVVDEQGRPLVVYHGTSQSFDEFDVTKQDSVFRRFRGRKGFFFTSSQEEAGYSAEWASLYTGGGENIIPAYIAISEPYTRKSGGDYPQKFFDANWSDLQSKAESKGSDGIIVNGTGKGDGRSTYVVFDPTQIKSAIGNAGTFDPNNASILYQGGNQSFSGPNDLGFYSRLVQTIEQKMGPTATKQQVEGLIKEIKPEERKWLGVDEFLKGKDKIKKDELLAFLKGNDLQIQEITKGGLQDDVEVETGLSVYPSEDVEGEWDVVNQNTGRVVYTTTSEEDAYRYVGQEEQSLRRDLSVSDTTFSKYTLPGGENYREVLFTLPSENEFTRFVAQMEEKYKYAPVENRLNEEEYQKYTELKQQYGKPNTYSSSHFSEENILAHTRLNDRVDSDGKKVLFVEEIQSDWHQDGRKKGYQGDRSFTEADLPANAKVIETQTNDGLFFQVEQDGIKDLNSTAKTREEAVRRWLKKRDRSVPDAPFKKTWHEFVMKRIIRMAAEQGYDRIAWTTGEQQADRYDLAKQVDAVYAKKNENGTYLIQVEKDGDMIEEKDGLSESDLETQLGKDLAKKIVDESGDLVESEDDDAVGVRMYSGVDLKVGGDGMKGFYDKMLVDFANKFGKKYGAKVGTTQIQTEAQEGSDMKLLQDLNSAPVGTTEKVHSLDITPALKDAALNEGFSLFQKQDEENRGFIQFGKDRKMNIQLLEKSDLSTVLHELGHFYLEVMQDLASSPNANEQLKTDFQIILNWFGVTPEQWSGFSMEQRREYHERFARAHEAYLMEGKAPSAELRSVFSKFKAWLKLIYKQLTALNVKLNDDVRAVFDRMYATDDAIEMAKKDVSVDPIFLTAQDAGMSEAEFALYRDTIQKASDSAKEALLAKAMADYKKQYTEVYKTAKKRVQDRVQAEAEAMPVYRAFKALVAGKIDDETPIKLSKEALVKKYGEEFIKRLPRSKAAVYTTSGGMDAEVAASYLGYESGDKLVEDLVNMKPMKDFVLAETDRRMIESSGDILLDGSMADEAKVALHNQLREQVLMTELKALKKKQAEVRPFVQAQTKAERERAKRALELPPTEAFKRAAEEAVSNTKVRDLTPFRYLQAGRKAARQAYEAAAKGNYELAAQAKQRELLNHFMYLEATKAKEEADSIYQYAKKFDKATVREKIGKAGADYLEQIDSILDRYEFRYVPFSKLDKRGTLLQWVLDQEAQGLEPAIDEKILNEARRINFKEVPISELRAIRDSVKNIEHLARLKGKLLLKKGQVEFANAVSELVEAAKKNGGSSTITIDPNLKSFSEKFKDGVSAIDSNLIKMEQLVEWLDGGDVNGAWHKYLWNPVAEAQTAEYDLAKEVTMKIVESLEKMPKEQRLSMLDAYDVPGIGKLTKKYILSMAFNMGNQENIDKMMKGHGWSMPVIEGALSNLNAQDWQFVQETWDTINSLWPKIAELEKRMTGVVPPKVEAQPYTAKAKDGTVIATLKGGYYPLVYDPNFSEQGAKQESGDLSQMFEQGYVRATTPKGHTKARVEGFAAPMLMDFEQVVTGHLTKVIKDLTHREAIVAVNKIITNKEVRQALQTTLGVQYERQFMPWLRSIVNDRSTASVQGVSASTRFLMAARANVVAYTMGFKATTAISQIVGLSQSLDMVKGRYLSKALTDFLKNPIKVTREVRELSGEMRHRSETLDRDIRARLSQLIADESAYAKAQKFAFHGIAIADTMVAVPTWLGAYRQAIEEGKSRETAILEADRAVRMTQGSGGAKDLSAVQRSNELMKSVTMFYSYFNVLYNRMRDMGRGVQDIRDMPKFLARAFFTVAVPAVLGELILGRGPDDDEDPAAWAIRKTLMYPTMSIPIVRDITASIESGYDYRFTPMASGFEKISKLAVSTGKLVDGEVEWDNYALKAADAIGMAAGVPGGAQINATGKYLWRVYEGEENPDNIAELIGYATVGKRKDK